MLLVDQGSRDFKYAEWIGFFESALDDLARTPVGADKDQVPAVWVQIECQRIEGGLAGERSGEGSDAGSVRHVEVEPPTQHRVVTDGVDVVRDSVVRCADDVTSEHLSDCNLDFELSAVLSDRRFACAARGNGTYEVDRRRWIRVRVRRADGDENEQGNHCKQHFFHAILQTSFQTKIHGPSVNLRKFIILPAVCKGF